jgi:hypothetical protein
MRVDPSFRGKIAAVNATWGSGAGTGQIVQASDEVSVNGGCGDPYPPVIWSARQVDDGSGITQLELSGLGLDQVGSLIVPFGGTSALQSSRERGDGLTSGTDTLVITSRTPTTVTAALAEPLDLGETVVAAGTDVATALTITQAQLTSTQSGNPRMTPPETGVQARDFAFIYAQGQFHLFYNRLDHAVPYDSTEVDFGHAVSTDLYNWTQLSHVMSVKDGTWDKLHVWAPSIIYRSGLYYMFYTGVIYVPFAWDRYQKTGLATSSNLTTWQRSGDPVYQGNVVPWVYADSTTTEGCAFRDPFVLPHDATGGDSLLMYYVATPNTAIPERIVGIAQSPTNPAEWYNVRPMWNTDAASPHYGFGACESPHVFLHNGKYYLFATTDNAHPIRYEFATVPTADSLAWETGSYRLYDADPNTDTWYGSEYLRVGQHEYLAAYNSANSSIEIREMSWSSTTDFTLNNPTTTAVPGSATKSDVLRLSVLRTALSSMSVGFRMEAPKATSARLRIYDLAGRKVRDVFAGQIEAGQRIVRWDGRSEDAETVGPGVYFARLDSGIGSRTARVVILR